MKTTLSNLALLAAAGTLLSAGAFAGETAVSTRAAKTAVQEPRGSDAQAPRIKPAAGAEVSRKEAKPDAGKPRQTEVPVAVVLAAD